MEVGTFKCPRKTKTSSQYTKTKVNSINVFKIEKLWKLQHVSVRTAPLIRTRFFPEFVYIGQSLKEYVCAFGLSIHVHAHSSA